MDDESQDLYLKALKLLNLRDLSRKSGRGYRTLHAYLRKEFNPSKEAMRELVEYLGAEAQMLTAAKEELEAALEERKEEADG